MTTAREKAFADQVAALVKRGNRLSNAEAAKVVELLEASRKAVAEAVAGTDWKIYWLANKKAAVERALSEFRAKAGPALSAAQSEAWALGVDLVDLPLQAVGLVNVLPTLDPTLLGVLQGYSADLITNVSADAIRRINTEITLGLLGDKSPYEVMERIGTRIDKGVFKSIEARAETIVRTEAGRAMEAAGQARKEAAAERVPGLQKQWWYGHSPREPRPSHMAAHGQIRDVDKPFDVGGYQLMYPKDPAAPASQTINCGCTSLPYHASWDTAMKDAA